MSGEIIFVVTERCIFGNRKNAATHINTLCFLSETMPNAVFFAAGNVFP